MENVMKRAPALVAAMTIWLGCGGGGGDGTGGGPLGNVTFTGTVSGTTIVAFDAQGSQVASATPTGTPPNRVFSIVVPVGGSYVLFLVENEGTVNQRVFPLYADGSLTTNRITLAEPGTIDLGFVDTSTGNAIPARNPLFGNGVTGAGQSTAIPASLNANGTIFAQPDLAGRWALHSLGVTSMSAAWIRAALVIAPDGMAEFADISASIPLGPQPPAFLKLTPSGVVSLLGADSRGVMSRSKDLVTLVMGAPGLGQTLGFLQKVGTGATPERLVGTWRFHQLRCVGEVDSLPGRGAWSRGNLVVGSDLQASASSDSFETSDPSRDNAAAHAMQFAMAPDGTVTSAGNATFHGTLAPDGNLVVATASDQDELVLLVMQRAGTGFTPADMVGTWSFRQLEYWPGTLGQFSYGKASIDSGMNATLVQVAPDPVTDGPFAIAISGDGFVSLTGSPSFRGAVSVDKGLLIATTSIPGEPTVEMVVLQR
jgi:hypothetical protein